MLLSLLFYLKNQTETKPNKFLLELVLRIFLSMKHGKYRIIIVNHVS